MRRLTVEEMQDLNGGGLIGLAIKVLKWVAKGCKRWIETFGRESAKSCGKAAGPAAGAAAAAHSCSNDRD